MRFNQRRSLALVFAFAAFFMAGEALAKKSCDWFGKAPFCNGKCPSGFKKIKTGKKGDGKKCATGKKAYCCRAAEIVVRGTAPLCNGRCKKGEIKVGTQKTGPKGKKCVTGKAAICLRK